MLTVSFVDLLWFAMYQDKSCDDKLDLNLLYVITALTIVSSMGNRTSP